MQAEMIAYLVETLASLLAAIFVFMMLVKDREQEPLSWPMALLCALLCGLLIYAFRSQAVLDLTNWPMVIALCVGFLGWGAWEMRGHLFGPVSPDAELISSNGQSIAGNMLIAATEEWLFRGYLQTSLLHFFTGPSAMVMALFVTNLLFALIHAPRGFVFAMSAGFVGMIMSMTVILSGSIWPAVVTHMLWNLMVGMARRRATRADA